MNCHTIQPLLSSYFDQECTSEESRMIELHVLACTACSQQLDQWQNVQQRLQSVNPLESNTSEGNEEDIFPQPLTNKVFHEIENHKNISDTLLSEYLDEECTPEEEKWVSEHLEICGSCHQLLKDLEKAQSMLQMAQPQQDLVVPDLFSSIMDKVNGELFATAPTHLNVSSEHLGDSLSAFLDQELQPEIQKLFELHCSQCAYCSLQVKQMREMMTLFREANSEEAPRNYQELVQQDWLKTSSSKERSPAEPVHKKKPAPALVQSAEPVPPPISTWLRVAALFLFSGGIFFYGLQEWMEFENRSKKNLNSQVSQKKTLPEKSLPQHRQQNQEILLRQARCQKPIEFALVSFSEDLVKQEPEELTSSLEKLQGLLTFSQEIVQELQITYNPYEGDLHLWIAVLEEFRFQQIQPFLTPKEAKKELKELQQHYQTAKKCYQRPLSLTLFQLPKNFPVTSFKENYAELESLQSDLEQHLKEIQKRLASQDSEY